MGIHIGCRWRVKEKSKNGGEVMLRIGIQVR